MVLTQPRAILAFYGAMAIAFTTWRKGRYTVSTCEDKGAPRLHLVSFPESWLTSCCPPVAAGSCVQARGQVGDCV